MNRLVFALCLITLVFVASLALANIPKLINYQGMLTNSSGDPLTGTYDITFKIYNASSGGDKRWEETQTDVAVTNGLFNVILGNATVGGIDLDFSEEYWLEVTVEGEQMGERLRFTSVGYAYRASVADSAVVAGSSAGGVGGWIDDGSVVRLVNNTDRVGIGTTSPWAGLHLKGSSFPSSFMYLQSDANQDAGIRLYEGADVKWHIFNSSPDSGLRIYNSNGSRTVFFGEQNSGNVGIGTTSPSEKLTVGGGDFGVYPSFAEPVIVTDGYNVKLGDPDGIGNQVYLEIDDPGNKFVFRNGNVGIGTTSPDTTLHVNGNLKVTGAYTGEIGPNNGAPFPRPAYDSGWRTISQNQTLTLTHNIGGNVDNYFVDLWFKGAVGRHNYAYGGEIDPSWDYRGAYWRELTGTQIEVYRNPDDGSISQIRVRIWVYQ